jgi:hypothetical protein
MKTRSKHKSLLLNILVMVFMMNTSLAHSTCHMGGDMSSGTMNDSMSSNATQSQQAMASMPCHEADGLETNSPETNSSEANSQETGNSSANALNQCCSDCSVLSLPMDRLQTVATHHAAITSIILIPSISRTIELLFRPPITALS